MLKKTTTSLCSGYITACVAIERYGGFEKQRRICGGGFFLGSLSGNVSGLEIFVPSDSRNTGLDVCGRSVEGA